LIKPENALRAITEHTAIIDAIEAGGGPEAERLARAHIEATISQLEDSRDSSEAEPGDAS
jgi:DNA-binding GntR family transcriptional regulator